MATSPGHPFRPTNSAWTSLRRLNPPAPTQWAVAMNLKHRSGVRWGELIALRPSDLDFDGSRVIRVERAVEQSRTGARTQVDRDRQRHATTFPASLADPLRELCDRVERHSGNDALLFPSTNGGYTNRRTFQRTLPRAAREAGWPMKRDTSSIWHVHDLRHVAACWLLFDVKLDPAAVSTLLGHTNAAFTLSRYVGVRGDLAATASSNGQLVSSRRPDRLAYRAHQCELPDVRGNERAGSS